MSACGECLTLAPTQQQQPLQPSSTNAPFDMVGIDLFSLRGQQFLVMVDHFSGLPFVAPLKPTTTKSILSKLSAWFMDFGFPHIIRSDGGPQFRGEFNDFCKKHGIEKQLSSAYFPQSNGLAESGVKSMKRLLKKVNNNWPKFLEALLHWRNMPRADGVSPAQMFFGFRQNFGVAEFHNLPRFIDREQAAKERQLKLRQPAANHFNSHARELPQLQLHDHVRVQDKTSGNWDTSATITEILPDGRSYLVADEHGHSSKRNRRDLRVDASASL